MKLLVAATLCCSLLLASARAEAEDAPSAKPKRSLYDLGLGPYFGPAPPPLSYAVPAPAVVGPPPPAFVPPPPAFVAPAPVVTKVVAPLPVAKVAYPVPLPPPVVTRVTYPLPPVVTRVSYPVPSLLAKLAYHAAPPPLPFALPPAPVAYAAHHPYFAKVAAPLPYW